MLGQPEAPLCPAVAVVVMKTRIPDAPRHLARYLNLVHFVYLVDDVEPERVAQLVPARQVRVVARAARVEVARLHQRDVAPHRRVVERGLGLAARRVMLVPVDARDRDRGAVHAEQPIVGVDRDVTEADAARLPLRVGAAAVAVVAAVGLVARSKQPER